jgi:hypothetical protein
VSRRHSGNWVCRICSAANSRSLGPSAGRAGAGATSGPRRRKRARASGATGTDFKFQPAQNRRACEGLQSPPPLSESQFLTGGPPGSL